MMRKKIPSRTYKVKKEKDLHAHHQMRKRIAVSLYGIKQVVLTSYSNKNSQFHENCNPTRNHHAFYEFSELVIPPHNTIRFFAACKKRTCTVGMKPLQKMALLVVKLSM